MLDSDEDGSSDNNGSGGVAMPSGLKAMLTRARGDSPMNVNATTDTMLLLFEYVVTITLYFDLFYSIAWTEYEYKNAI